MKMPALQKFRRAVVSRQAAMCDSSCCRFREVNTVSTFTSYDSFFAPAEPRPRKSASRLRLSGDLISVRATQVQVFAYGTAFIVGAMGRCARVLNPFDFLRFRNLLVGHCFAVSAMEGIEACGGDDPVGSRPLKSPEPSPSG